MVEVANAGRSLVGPRFELSRDDSRYPAVFKMLEKPPERLYVIGEPDSLEEGLAVVGARRATPYGRGCAGRFARIAAERGIAVISGGARGCDAVAHEAALAAGGKTVAFLGGGLDELYPAENRGLFQRIVNAGGAVVSEHDWGFPPVPYAFRERNRLIASLARATLIVEAGLPSGTFSTADAALAANREVLVVPGAITSPTSKGANRLLFQGATPVIDEETFADALLTIFGCLKQETIVGSSEQACSSTSSDHRMGKLSQASRQLLEALRAEPMGMESLRGLAVGLAQGNDPLTWLMVELAVMQREGLIAQYPDGRYGPCVVTR